MKLYATVTSERATKGQGGERLDIEITCMNEDTQLADKVCTVRSFTDNGGNITLRVTSLVSEQDLDILLPVRYSKTQKGKRQKGECVNHHNCAGCRAGISH